MTMPRRWRLFLIATAVALVADQASKIWARATLAPGVRVPFLGDVWDWDLSFNPGASFSSFAGLTGARVLLSLIAVGALVALGWMAHRSRDDQRLQLAGLGLVAGGALGNLIDRVATGAVTDFVAWRWGAHHWPTFNVADATLLIGVVLLLAAPGKARAGAGDHATIGT